MIINAVMPIPIMLPHGGGAGLSPNEVIYILIGSVILTQYITLCIMLYTEMFSSKIRFLLNLIPFFWTIEFIIGITKAFRRLD